MNRVIFLLFFLLFASVSGAWAHGGQGSTDTRLVLFENPLDRTPLDEGDVVGKLTISHNVVPLMFMNMGVKEVPESIEELLGFVQNNKEKVFDLLENSDQYVIQNDTKVCFKDSFVIDNTDPETFEALGLLVSFRVECDGPISVLRVKNGLFYDFGIEHFNFVNVIGKGDELLEGGMLTKQSHEIEVQVATPSGKSVSDGDLKLLEDDEFLQKLVLVAVSAVSGFVGGFLGFRAGKRDA